MRLLLLLTVAVNLGFAPVAARADALADAFKARIEAALAPADEAARLARIEKLFYRGGADDWAKKLGARTAKSLVTLHGQRISFVPLSRKSETMYVIDGYEYRPNLEPLGWVVFTDPAAAPGNNTKILYGRPPGKQDYFLPLTLRRLVNANAPPDRQLQILTVGNAYPASTFTGWCEIALSNNTVKRVTLADRKVGNQSLFLTGQSIRRCEVRNTTGRGSLSLRLYEDGRKLFERRVEFPKTVITYSKR